MYYVSIVREDATQGPLFGPYDLFDDAIKVLKQCLEKGLYGCPFWDVSAIEQDIEKDGFFKFPDGGGIFVCTCEDDIGVFVVP